jgi:hypothetical protein
MIYRATLNERDTLRKVHVYHVVLLLLLLQLLVSTHCQCVCSFTVRALLHYSSMLPAAESTPITTAAALSLSALAPSVTGLSDVVLVAGGPGVLQSLAKAPAKHLIAVRVVVFVQKYES